MQNMIVGAKDFRTNFVKYQKLVSLGRSLTVVRRSRPIFRVTPLESDEEVPTTLEIDQMLREGIKSAKNEKKLSPLLSSSEDISDYLSKL